MKLSRLLEQHKKFKDQGLSESLGDGFLMAHNRMYRQVRNAALSFGYKFTTDRNEAYEAFPLLQLESLLKAKTLPYVNNVIPFESLTAVQLENITWEDLEGNIKRNFVFHEGCHAIARALAQKHFKAEISGHDLDAQRLRALRMLLEESCANTAELLGVVDATDTTHRIFYEMNSYVCEFEQRTNLKNALAEFGEEFFTAFMVLCYLHSNFLREHFEDKDIKSILDLISKNTFTDKQLKTLKALAKVVFNLSERFRYQTTGFHLRLAGVQIPMEDLFDYDFMISVRREPGVLDFIQDFAKNLT
jgi:hypothetical protein